MKRLAIYFGIISALCSGCEKQSQPLAGANQEEKPAVKSSAQCENEASAQQKAKTVLARVDDEVLTVGDVADLVELHCALGRIRSRRFKDADEDKVRRRITKAAVGHFIEQRLLLKYARQNHLAPTADELEGFRNKGAKNHKTADFAAMMSKLQPSQQKLLESETRNELTAELARTAIRSQADTSVSEAEIANTYADLIRRNGIAAATNALIYATATNVYERIMREELTFEEAVQDYSEADEETSDGEWNEFKLDELDNEFESALKVRLPTMSSGEITPPIESDNGLAIVKLVSIGTSAGKNGAKGEETYRLSRIFFRLPLFVEIPTQKELEAAIVENRRVQKYRQTMKALGDASRVEGLKKKASK